MDKNFQGYIAAIAMYDEDIVALKEAGATEVYSFILAALLVTPLS